MENKKIEWETDEKTRSAGLPQKLTGGEPTIVQNMHCVCFDKIMITGKLQTPTIKIEGRPTLQLIVDNYKKEKKENEQKAKEKFDKNVEGYEILEKLHAQAYNERCRTKEELSEMMEDEMNDGVNPPEPYNPEFQNELEREKIKYPRAAMYLKFEIRRDDTHWADNTGKGSAAEKAMAAIIEGVSIADAGKIATNY